ncbi:Uncharacterised protein [Mycobacteroides abscessus subsp. abscessus]|nr:Uncharacterised protein [Mycobacteroides abscessus subsp. abscessus]SKO61030.1 Uncharacterised protein [Mycobacteroides abscessus subsp. abscessus]
MRPSHFHAPALPNKLPDQRPAYDRDGTLIHDGKTWPFTKVLKSLQTHQREELKRRTRNG